VSESLLCIVGPTGSGKSALAIDLAERFNGEIVNCDSVQLYRYLDIGTAKTPIAERRGIPHHLLDILDPDQYFTAGDYSRAARQAIAEISGRGRLPIVTGGTGFYLRALLDGLFPGPIRDQRLRDRLSRRPTESLHRILRRFDFEAAARIHKNDQPKLIRALEICLLAKEPATRLFRTRLSQPLDGYRVVKVGLSPDRSELVSRLNERCATMFDQGLLEEVAAVLKLGFPDTAKALMSIGYREAVQLLRGDISREEAVLRAQTATRQYAKRQRTWFRREHGLTWFPGFGNDKNLLEGVVHHLRVDINFI
jgi:tRNA dimethylallyltransferase